MRHGGGEPRFTCQLMEITLPHRSRGVSRFFAPIDYSTRRTPKILKIIHDPNSEHTEAEILTAEEPSRHNSSFGLTVVCKSTLIEENSGEAETPLGSLTDSQTEQVCTP